MSVTNFLPYGRQVIEDDDIQAVAEVLRSDFLTTGPAVGEFEKALKDVTGANEAVVCSSGTAALHLATHVLDLVPGDAVIVPAITFLATANVVRHCGAEVLFADVDAETGLMMPEHMEAALARAKDKHPDWRVKAAYPVYLAGQVADPETIAELADHHDLLIVEDACHALGSHYGGNAHPVGACHHAKMSCFSFHPVKNIAMGEGGAVTTNDKTLADRLRKVCSHGLSRNAEDYTQQAQAFAADGTPNPWYYEMHEAGFNYRASDIQCALAKSQLGKLDRFLERRRQLVDVYDQAVQGLSPSVRPLGRTDGRPGWHLYVVLIDFDSLGKDRGDVMRQLRERGIGTQVHYIPVSSQPYYRSRYGEPSLPGAESYYSRALSLPLFPSMEDSDVARVIEALRDILAL